MRKFFAMLLVSSMMLGLMGCSGEPAKKDDKAPATPAKTDDKKAEGDKKDAPPADKKDEKK